MSEINILYGAPGAGKTTAANLLPKDIEYLSVGKLARQEIELKTKFGKKLLSYINNLEEYPKPIIKKLIEKPIINSEKIILVDGFPKFEREVEVLEDIMEDNSLLPGFVFNINISHEDAWDRIKDRKVCPNCDYQSTEQTCCPDCKELLKTRDGDSYEDFAIRYQDYELNNNLVKSKLIKLGFKAIEMSLKTPQEYCDIITDSLLNHARVAQKREQLESFQEVDS